MSALEAGIAGIGVLGPGLPDWPAAALRARQAQGRWQHRGRRFPGRAFRQHARRRTGAVVRLTLAVGLEATGRAGVDPAGLPTVFTSSGGDGQTCHEICEALATVERQLSPIRFHNSVHNAPAGYWGIATGATAAANSLCAYDASFAAGLLEALCQVAVEHTPVLLIAYDASYPEPIRSVRPIPDAFGVALLLVPGAGTRAVARLGLTMCDGPADRMTNPALERLRSSIPAARSLPLLALLARAAEGRVLIDYLGGACIALEVSACR